MNLDPAATSLDLTEHAIVLNPFNNTSCYALDTHMTEDNDDEIDNYDITKLHAAVLLTDIKCDSETKKQFITRIEDFLLAKFDSLAKVIFTKNGDHYLAITILHNSEQHAQLISSIFEELKINESADTPMFYQYDS